VPFRSHLTAEFLIAGAHACRRRRIEAPILATRVL